MSVWAITGGSGFLGLHLSRRLLLEGHTVRSLDLEPAELPAVEGIVGDVRDPVAARLVCRGAEVLVHAAAALPIRGSRRAIWSVNVEGTATILAAAVEAGVRRVVFISSAVVLPRPIEVYGEAKAEAEQLCRDFAGRGLEVTILRPQAFVGPGRLGIFGILFRWIAEGRRIYTVGPGSNRYQLLDVDDLVEAIGLAPRRPVANEALALGAKEFGTVAEDLRALIDHAGSKSRLTPLPARSARALLRALHLAGLSPLGEWHYRTAGRDCFVDIAAAERGLGWSPRFSNGEALARGYDSYLAGCPAELRTGWTHRTPWNEKALALLRRLS
ncbi:MAG: NAD-dependent epimerase/dehydratase family protein [Gaiellaceae bacterium]